MNAFPPPSHTNRWLDRWQRHHTAVFWPSFSRTVNLLAVLNISLFFLPLLAAGTLAVEETTKPLAPGQAVPAASLRDTAGKESKLHTLIADKPTVLIFYRGGWCPFCNKHLMALVSIVDDLKAAGYQLLAISPDQPAKLKETPNRGKLDYTLLSDSEMRAARAFGIAFQVPAEIVAKYKSEYQIDLEAASGQTHHLLPHPAVFIVDATGVIRFAHVNPDYKQRLDPAAILKAARENTTP